MSEEEELLEECRQVSIAFSEARRKLNALVIRLKDRPAEDPLRTAVRAFWVTQAQTRSAQSEVALRAIQERWRIGEEKYGSE